MPYGIPRAGARLFLKISWHARLTPDFWTTPAHRIARRKAHATTHFKGAYTVAYHALYGNIGPASLPWLGGLSTLEVSK